MTLNRRVAGVAVLTALLFSFGCYDSEFPLDATAQADVQQAVLGAWRCIQHDVRVTERPFTITVAPGRERTYSVTFQQDGEKATLFEAHASVIHGETVVNVRALSGGWRPWVFTRYVLLTPSILSVQLLNEDALSRQESPSALRGALERLGGKPGAYVDMCVCARARLADEPEK